MQLEINNKLKASKTFFKMLLTNISITYLHCKLVLIK